MTRSEGTGAGDGGARREMGKEGRVVGRRYPDQKATAALCLPWRGTREAAGQSSAKEP